MNDQDQSNEGCTTGKLTGLDEVDQDSAEPCQGELRVWWDSDRGLWFVVDVDSNERLFGETRADALRKIDNITAYDPTPPEGEQSAEKDSTSTPETVSFGVGEEICGRKVSTVKRTKDGALIFSGYFGAGLYPLVKSEEENSASEGADETVCGEEKGWIRREVDGTVSVGGPYEPGVFTMISFHKQ